MEKNIFKKNTFEMTENEREAIDNLFEGFKYWNALVMNEVMLYLTDETVDREKTSMQEWVTDGRAEMLLEYVIHFVEFNYEKLPLLKEQLKKVKLDSIIEKVKYLNSIFDFTDENDCKMYLELEEEHQQTKSEPLGKHLCPRCGKTTARMEYSLYGKICICRACRKEEKNLAAKGRRLPFTEWEYIESIRENQDRME